MTAIADPAAAEAAARALVAEGVELCRAGQWDRGVARLSEVAAGSADPQKMPGLFFSYLGYGMAKLHGRKDEGLKLCKRAIELEFYQADNYLNLARVYMLLKQRREAIDTIEQGLKIDRDHRGLRDLQEQFGQRRDPVIAKLGRGHLLNRLLGKIRHDFAGKKTSK
jgi:tetratricopeptide (TPR) repeat protein